MEYQGHPSWNHWNVSLWLNNDEPLYRFCLDSVRTMGVERAAHHVTAAFWGEKTPDGAPYDYVTVHYAIRNMEEEL